MAIRARKGRQTFAEFCLDLMWFITHKAGPKTELVQQRSITLSDMQALPRETQLLLAHSLMQRQPDLMLLKRDTDIDSLLSHDWLTQIPCSTRGIVCYKYKPDIWRQLVSLRVKFMTATLIKSLKSYRKAKSAMYPWIWW